MRSPHLHSLNLTHIQPSSAWGKLAKSVFRRDETFVQGRESKVSFRGLVWFVR